MRLDTIQKQPDMLDKQAVEEYLIKMASEGQFVTKSGVFLKFEQGEPKKVRYHLAPYQNKKKRQEVDGWEFVTSLANLYLIYKVKEDTLEEFPISWEEERKIFFKKYIVQRRCLILDCSGLCILVGILIAALIYLCLQQENAVATIVCTERSYITEFVALLSISLTISQMIACEQVRCLAFGERVAQISKKVYTLSGLLYLFLFFMLFLLFYQSKSTWEEDLGEYKNELPMIRLEMMEDSSDFELEQGKEHYNEEYFVNRIYHRWSLLVPEHYAIDELGYDKDGETSELYSEYFEFRFAVLGERFFDEYVALRVNELREYYYVLEENSLSDTPFDKAVLISGEGVEAFFGLSGDRVIYSEYTGDKQLEDFVESIYQEMAAF